MTLHKSMIKSNIPHSEKKKNLPKTLFCSSEIHTTVRNKKAACDRKRKVRHQCKWEALGKMYKTPDARASDAKELPRSLVVSEPVAG